MSSKEHLGCNGKVRYNNMDEAYLAIYSHMIEVRSGNVLIKVYKCKQCKGFHLTSELK